jgi:hypothetical protein
VGLPQDGRSYFNWDVSTDQKKLSRDPYFHESLNRDPKAAHSRRIACCARFLDRFSAGCVIRAIPGLSTG